MERNQDFKLILSDLVILISKKNLKCKIFIDTMSFNSNEKIEKKTTLEMA